MATAEPGKGRSLAELGEPDIDARDYTNLFNTQLSPKDEQQFQSWIGAQSAAVGRSVSNDLYDYDLRGWWQNNKDANLSNAHLVDTFKKPNHPTFSDQSTYSNPTLGTLGGQWLQRSDGQFNFSPGPSGLFSAPELQGYFRRVEPASQLLSGTTR